EAVLVGGGGSRGPVCRARRAAPLCVPPGDTGAAVRFVERAGPGAAERGLARVHRARGALPVLLPPLYAGPGRVRAGQPVPALERDGDAVRRGAACLLAVRPLACPGGGGT